MTGNYIGIDLGTANTIVCTKHDGIIIREPSYVTYDPRTNRVLAVGNEAKNAETLFELQLTATNE